MGTNRRYADAVDRRMDQRILEATTDHLIPTTLPQQAFGPNPFEWVKGSDQPPVWAWVSWSNAPASRIPAVASGWNDRVVCVEWEARGGRRSVIVWRTAVTRRSVR